MKNGLFFIATCFVFFSCNQTSKKELKKSLPRQQVDYVALGNKYAHATQKVLGKNLVSKIKREGTLAALTFCNVKAFPLTDSMSVVHKVAIQRISDKNRNKKNAVNSEELAYLETFKKQQANYESLLPIIKETSKLVHFYSPIKVVPKCLQCHGIPENDIKPIVFKSIKELYPADKAIGYTVNDIRGMWHITFQKNNIE